MHIMVDLETLSTSSNAAIISIGAVAFDKEGIKGRFYRNVDFQSAVKNSDVDGSTVAFWFKQNDEARMKFFEGEPVSLGVAMSDFSTFISEHGELEGVWGNGATFDNVILDNAYNSCFLQKPWPFWKDRCYRTMKSENPQVPFVREGVYHNALDDAQSQAKHLIEIWRQSDDKVE